MFNFLRPIILPNVLPCNIIRSYEGYTSSCDFVDGFAGLDYHKDTIFWYVTWESPNVLKIYGKVNKDNPRLHSEHTICTPDNMGSVFSDASYLACNWRNAVGMVNSEFRAARKIFALGREGALKQYAEYANIDAPKPPRPYR